MRRLTCGFSRKRRCGGTRGRHLDEPRPSRLTDGRTHTVAPREAPGQGIERINGPYKSPTPNECASIGDSPGPTDHLYNAGTVGHRILRRRTSEFHIRSANRSILVTTGSVSSSSRIDAN